MTEQSFITFKLFSLQQVHVKLYSVIYVARLVFLHGFSC